MPWGNDPLVDDVAVGGFGADPVVEDDEALAADSRAPRGPVSRLAGRALDRPTMPRHKELMGRMAMGAIKPVAGFIDLVTQVARPMEQAAGGKLDFPVSRAVKRVTGMGRPDGAGEIGAEIVGGMALPGGFLAQTAYGAGLGAYENESLGGAGEGAAWSAGGYVAGQLIGRGVNAVRSALSSKPAPLGNLGQAAVDAGLPVTPAQALARSGEKSALLKVEAAFESMPWTGVKSAKISAAQKQLLTQSAAKAVGQQADLITPGVLDNAATEIGYAIEKSAAKMRPVNLPRSLLDQVDKVVTTEPFLEIGITKGKMGPDEYLKARSALDKVSRNAWKAGDSAKAEFVDKIIDRLDNIAEVRGANLAAHGKARSQWRMLRVLERGNVIQDGGVVSAAASKRALESVYGPTMRRGRGAKISPEAADFMAKSRALSELPKISDSGTITRGSLAILGADLMTTGGAATAASAAGSYAYFSSPMAIARIAGGLAESPVLTSKAGAAAGRMAYETTVEDLP
jgi:hypothetical protein